MARLGCILLSVCVSAACAFAPPIGALPLRLRQRSPLFRMSEDEIAELEEKLARAKAAAAAKAEEDERAAMAAAAAARAAAVERGDDLNEFDAATLSFRKKVAATQLAPPDELLSEAWKESTEDGVAFDAGGAIKLGLVTIGIIALALIPTGDQNVGQAPAAPLPTAQQIRSKYEGIGAL